MRLLHTADWHLGHQLHGVSRDYEHRQFLHYLLDCLVAEQVDTLIICGDIFDSANPPASAQALFYDFLAQARKTCPQLNILIIAGNHDSPARLSAPQPLLRSLGIHLIGLLPRDAQGQLQAERLVFPLFAGGDEPAAWCAVVPFLRPADLDPPTGDSNEDELVAGVRDIYQRVIAAAEAQRTPEQALIVTGHCYLRNGKLSELSERKILGGNQHALPSDIFPANCDYVALGHLHRAQCLSEQPHIAYSGSPLPLSLAEADYPHQVRLIEFSGGRVCRREALRVPRSVPIKRLGPAPLADIMRQLDALDWPSAPAESWPFLEISVQLRQPEPGLRHQLDERLKNQPVRLLNLVRQHPGADINLAQQAHQQSQDLGLLQNPQAVFARYYDSQYQHPPTQGLNALFHELLDNLDSE